MIDEVSTLRHAPVQRPNKLHLCGDRAIYECDGNMCSGPLVTRYIHEWDGLSRRLRDSAYRLTRDSSECGGAEWRSRVRVTVEVDERYR